MEIFQTAFTKEQNNPYRYAQVCLSDDGFEQTFLAVIHDKNAGARVPICIYPMSPSAKELFGKKRGIGKRYKGSFCMARDLDHMDEVILLSPGLKELNKSYERSGKLSDKDLRKLEEEMKIWMRKTRKKRAEALERRKIEKTGRKEKEHAEQAPFGKKGCERVVMSNRAYLSLFAETLSRDPVETGGIFFGNYSKDGTWYVVETTDPGMKTFHNQVHCEMDEDYHNHLFSVLSRLYKKKLNLLGLWHRHPGSMDHFSQDDMRTNAAFADAVGNGTISLLVNMDPTPRLTCYYLDADASGLRCRKVPVYIGDSYFKGTEYLEYNTPENLWDNQGKLQRDIQSA